MTDRAEINRLSREVAGLSATVSALTTTWREQEQAAASSRRVLYEKFEQLRTEFSETGAKVGQLTNEVAAIKPVIKKVEQDRWRAEGMKSLGKLVWLGLMAFAGGVGWCLHEAFLYFSGRPH